MPIRQLATTAAAILGIALFASACISLRVRDLKELGIHQVECSARDDHRGLEAASGRVR